MKLYEINSMIDELLGSDAEKVIDTETGEILDISEMLDKLELQLEDKWENIANYIKTLNAEAEAIKAEESKLKQRREQKDKLAEKLKEWLSSNLIYNKRNKFERATCKLTFRKSESVDIWDELKVPDEFKREWLEVKIDKAAIKEAIKRDGGVDGAELIEKQNLQIK